MSKDHEEEKRDRVRGVGMTPGRGSGIPSGRKVIIFINGITEERANVGGNVRAAPSRK